MERKTSEGERERERERERELENWRISPFFEKNPWGIFRVGA